MTHIQYYLIFKQRIIITYDGKGYQYSLIEEVSMLLHFLE